MIDLILGDASRVLLDRPPGFADMVYLDPPFGTQKLWKGANGNFSDRFEFDATTRQLAGSIRERHARLAAMIDACPGGQSRQAYLFHMASILMAVHRSLALTGSMWLHCDETSGAYLKVCADFIFGPGAWLGDIIWRRTSAHSDSHTYGRVHDTIFCYGRSRATRWRLWRLKSDWAIGDPLVSFHIGGIADRALNATATERVGYPTQKPLALLNRLIAAATLPGATVLDPTCGSGTTVIAAMTLGRRAIGIDRSHDAIAVATKRVHAAIPRQPDLFAA